MQSLRGFNDILVDPPPPPPRAGGSKKMFKSHLIQVGVQSLKRAGVGGGGSKIENQMQF